MLLFGCCRMHEESPLPLLPHMTITSRKFRKQAMLFMAFFQNCFKKWETWLKTQLFPL